MVQWPYEPDDPRRIWWLGCLLQASGYRAWCRVALALEVWMKEFGLFMMIVVCSFLMGAQAQAKSKSDEARALERIATALEGKCK